VIVDSTAKVAAFFQKYGLLALIIAGVILNVLGSWYGDFWLDSVSTQHDSEGPDSNITYKTILKGNK
jgi:hypothetical protein